MKNKNLNDWIFNWNCYTEQWRAVKRDDYKELFNNNNSPLVLRSSRFQTLVDLINRTDGNKEKIESLTKIS